MNIKQIRQDAADTDASLKKVKATLGEQLNVSAKDRTPEQIAALVETKAELTRLEGLSAVIADDLAVAMRAQDVERAQGTPVIHMGADHATDRPWGPTVAADAAPYLQSEARHMAFGNFAQAVRQAALGNTDTRLFAAAQGAGTQVDSNLGFAVPQEVAPGIEREMFASGEILSRVDARTISGNSIAYNLVDETSRADGSRGGGVLGYWVDEGTAPTASNTKLARMEMKLRKVGAFGVMTDELLSDAVALGGELESAFAAELIFQVENKVWRGNGANAPLGFSVAPSLVSVAKETGQAATTLVNTNLLKMWARMKTRSKANAVWLYNTDIGPQLNVLSQDIGTGGIPSRVVNYGTGGAISIFGRPAIEVEYAETLGTKGDLALVDLSQYRLIRKGGIEQASSMHVYFSTGEQAFRAFYRVDGQPVPRAPLTPFKGSATLSSFVVLDTRA